MNASSTTMTVPELYEHLQTFDQSGLHFQRQRHYEANHSHMGPWLAGDVTTPPIRYWTEFGEWADLIGRHVAAGHRVERLRVHADPMTDCQAWERWLGRWNAEAGEVIRYLAEADADSIGLTVEAWPDDFWLLDESLLIVMPWTADGRDEPMMACTAPEIVADAQRWWDLAWAVAASDDEESVV